MSDVYVVTQIFNATNPVDNWSYDGARNLLDDRTTTYTYDAFNRMTQRSSTS